MDEQPQASANARKLAPEFPLAWSVNEFCQVVPCGRSTIYDEIRCGRLKARKLRKRTVILHEDGLAYLRSLPTQIGTSQQEPESKGTKPPADLTANPGPERGHDPRAPEDKQKKRKKDSALSGQRKSALRPHCRATRASGTVAS